MFPVKEGPTFPLCTASLVDKRNGRNEVFQVNCSYYGDDVKVYTNMRDFTHVRLQWHASYRKLEDLPPYPSDGYMRTFRVGVIHAEGQVLLKDTGRTTRRLSVCCPSLAGWLAVWLTY